MSEKVLTSFVLARMPEAPAWSFYVGISADTAARILADPTEARGYILESFQHRDMGNLGAQVPGIRINRLFGLL